MIPQTDGHPCLQVSRALLIDDEPDLQRSVSDFLKREAFQVTCTKSAEEAFDQLQDHLPDVILLDLNLPQMSGFELCKQIKEHPGFQGVPILIISSRASEPDKVMGLELGADDYLVKPFGMRELLARLRALLRRSGAGSDSPDRQLKSGAIHLDMESHAATVQGKPVRLTPKEFELLMLLVRHTNRLLKREVLLQAVWPGSESLPNTLDVHINRLREKLGSEGTRIETYKGLGYKLAGC